MPRRDGDDDDQPPKKTPPEKEPHADPGDTNLGEEIGTQIGEGHDPVEDEVK